MEPLEKTSEEITQEINTTYESLSGKVHSLETGLSESLHDARASIETTLKEVKSIFDFKHSTALIGCCIALGCALNHFIPSLLKSNTPINPIPSKPKIVQPEELNLMEEIKNQVKIEAQLLKNHATQLALTSIEASLKGSIPDLVFPSVARIFSNLRQKLD